jgi:hypothetical protein
MTGSKPPVTYTQWLAAHTYDHRRFAADTLQPVIDDFETWLDEIGKKPPDPVALWRAKIRVLCRRLDRKEAQRYELMEQFGAAVAACDEAEEGTALWIVRDRVVRGIEDELRSMEKELEPLNTQLTSLAIAYCRRAPGAPGAIGPAPPYWGDADGWMANQAKANRKFTKGAALAACLNETGVKGQKARDAWGKYPKHLKSGRGRPRKSV